MCQNDDAIPPFPDTKPALKATQVAICRHTTVLTVRRVLEHCLARFFSKRVLWKLMKDTAKSAERKASRALAELAPALTRAWHLARTALRGVCAMPVSLNATSLYVQPLPLAHLIAPLGSHGSRLAIQTDRFSPGGYP